MSAADADGTMPIGSYRAATTAAWARRRCSAKSDEKTTSTRGSNDAMRSESTRRAARLLDVSRSTSPAVSHPARASKSTSASSPLSRIVTSSLVEPLESMRTGCPIVRCHGEYRAAVMARSRRNPLTRLPRRRAAVDQRRGLHRRSRSNPRGTRGLRVGAQSRGDKWLEERARFGQLARLDRSQCCRFLARRRRERSRAERSKARPKRPARDQRVADSSPDQNARWRAARRDRSAVMRSVASSHVAGPTPLVGRRATWR